MCVLLGFLFLILIYLKPFSPIRGFAARSGAPPEAAEFNGTLYASCRMKPSTKLAEGLPKVYGQVLFKQAFPTGPLHMMISLKGFPTVGHQQRAIHIHQYGDLSNGCDSTGGHYNPLGVDHPGHPGDFGNFVPHDGRIWAQKSERATLSGRLSVLGRAVVVHEKEDDLGLGGDAGSLLHGNSGRRLACCIIGISSDKLWNKAVRQPRRN
uniref:Superoxide dismutase [Cu-Zn] n=1 Tax=Scleropages formosus TaxID=113540 RepID=A0A8C9QYA1_SCLFO